MKVELVNMTNYANIYGIYDETGKRIGTVENRLAGCDVGTYAYSFSGKYNKRDIKRFWREARKNKTTVY